ncbi:MAG: hypothetical protein HPZ91_08675 [Lentisphaeria bacterium]|nr:hypothetical protein [Lentisphaeria bacterium]
MSNENPANYAAFAASVSDGMPGVDARLIRGIYNTLYFLIFIPEYRLFLQKKKRTLDFARKMNHNVMRIRTCRYMARGRKLRREQG